jgi:hypothetical protein
MILGSTYFSSPTAFAAIDFILRATQQVYKPGDTLVIYGAAAANEVLAIRLYDPSGLAIRIDNVQVGEDGFFRKSMLTWPDPSRNLPFGTYTIEIISSVLSKTQRAEVAFAEGVAAEAPVLQFPKTHSLIVKLDAPSEVTVNKDFRIFVQITFDGALVDVNEENKNSLNELLGASHIHSSNSTIILNDKFVKLHPGLYYADVKLDKEEAYIIHAAAFYKGFLSHDSRVITAGATTGTIQESVDKLNLEISQLQNTLDDTKSTITDSVDEARKSIREDIRSVRDASGQINALILPLLALISVIIALQISLFARIRASYR